MANELNNFLVDKRIVDRNIDKGLLGRKDFEGYLEKLPDVEELSEVVDLSEDGQNAEGEAAEGAEGEAAPAPEATEGA